MVGLPRLEMWLPSLTESRLLSTRWNRGNVVVEENLSPLRNTFLISTSLLQTSWEILL